MEVLTIDQLREKANKLPLKPGVYLMLDQSGAVIYVGKAKALKNRVTSYFRGAHLPKVAAMVEHVADFNVIVVQSDQIFKCLPTFIHFRKYGWIKKLTRPDA